MKIFGEGLTFDDVLVIPRKSEKLPSQVDVSTFITKNVKLNIPLVSAAMDTVTEAELAIAMAREGGLGFIHKNLSIAQQAMEVEKVKRCENGMIVSPITLSKNSTLLEAEETFAKFKISGLPVVDSENKILGIITNRDIKFRKLDESKVSRYMTPKERLILGKVGTTLEEAKKILCERRIEKLPIVDEDDRLVGLITIKDIDKAIKFPCACKDEQGRLRCGASIGVSADSMQRLEALVRAGVDVVSIDSAHGHSLGVMNLVRAVKKEFPDLDLIGGNIATGEAAKDLIEAGVDALKVGIGPGSICTTRVVAGVGVPQITAIMEVYDVAKKHNIPVIADGGVKFSGDVVKALVVGANVCMLGGLLAGTSETPGEEILLDGRRYKVYVGMGSLASMKRGSKDRYFQSQSVDRKLVPEGIEGKVAFKGSAGDVIFQLVGGIRAGMGYTGASNIKQLQETAQMVKISAAGLRESHPHSISISKQAPNYNI